MRKPEWLIENAKDGTLLALIPEGEFLAGGAGHDEGDGPFPVRLPGYYLGLHCVTNGQYARFLSEARPGNDDLQKWISLDKDCFVRQAGERYEAYGGKEEHPVVQVSWYGAEAYCEWSRLRLPSELEWEKGARGVDGRKFPWGNEWDASKCQNNMRLGNATTTGVWGYAQGASPWGLYQMSGNVWELCGDRYKQDAYRRYKVGDLTPQTSGNHEVVSRGGAWRDDIPAVFECDCRDSSWSAFGNFHIGFRCARTI